MHFVDESATSQNVGWAVPTNCLSHVGRVLPDAIRNQSVTVRGTPYVFRGA